MWRLLAGITLAAAMVFATLGAQAQSVKSAVPEYVEGATLITPAQAKALWDRDVKFVDVRTPKLFEEGRIPGATFLEFISDFNEENLNKLAGLNDEIVIYCMGPG